MNWICGKCGKPIENFQIYDIEGNHAHCPESGPYGVVVNGNG